jgi:hypothetical protein
MMVAAARALCAQLEIRVWDDEIQRAATDRATAALLAAAPQVAPAETPGTWWVGAGGFDALGGERSLAESLLDIARRWHPGARVAVADSCMAAWAGSWDCRKGERSALENGGGGRKRIEGTHAPVIIPAGQDPEYLSAVPLTLLPVDAEIRESCESLGILTAGGLSALGLEDVERRWGAAGVRAWRLARGEDGRRPVLALPERPRSVEVELAGPAETIEPALFVVRAALERLVPQLVRDGRAAATVAITLVLDEARSALPTGARAHTLTREVRLPSPVARVGPLAEHCRALLEGWNLTAPMCGVGVAITATTPASGDQGDLLDSSWRDPAAATSAAARIRSVLGTGTVVRAEARDGYAVERSGGWVEVDGRARAMPDNKQSRRGKVAETIAGDAAAISGSINGSAALRLLERPESVDVELQGETPSAVWWRGGRLTIERVMGPERLAGDWWARPYAREYWRCGCAAGELLVYADAGQGGWYVQGWYD